MKKIIISLLKSAIGRAIVQALIEYFLEKAAKKGYYVTTTTAGSGNVHNIGNIATQPAYRKAMAAEFAEFDLDGFGK